MKYSDFKKAIDKPYFSVQDIRLRGLIVYPYQLTLWKRESLLASFKRGWYYFPEKKKYLTPEVISKALYSPSYISSEFALRVYGCIPEMVYTCTSLTSKTTRKFSNEFGMFSYRHIRPEVFCGYHVVREGELTYTLADPEKALLDLIYLRLDMRSEEDIASL